MGLGLAKIREGDVDEGTKEIETTASLDPNNSLIRSYLGKAYFEQKRGGLASTEFEQAKLLDPKDPTPFFYGAIKKQTENRPVEALHDFQKAIELNDNRAVYRSRLLLDSDLAARSASLGRIYRDLGFEQVALVEGWRSVNTDPSDYSGHRLLADSYLALPRHEIARVSELLQSQLLQPLNATPVQPSLAESNLLILEGAGPSAQAFNEFNPLFTRNRLNLQTSAIVGSNSTFGDEVVQSGIWDNFSYSLGQFHYETDGFRENNDLTQDIYNVFAQGALSPNLNLQVEVRHREIEHGDLDLNVFKLFGDSTFNPEFNRELRFGTVRLGAHYAVMPHSGFIASAIYQDVGEFQDFGEGFQRKIEQQAYLAEAQYIFLVPHVNLILGGGNYGFDRAEETHGQHGNVYMYANVRYPSQLTWTLGVSFDSLDHGDLGEFNFVNPKFGIRQGNRMTLKIKGLHLKQNSMFSL